MNQFTRIDTCAADGVTVTYHRRLVPDVHTQPGDFECYDAERIAAWTAGHWGFVGVVCRACVFVVSRGHGVMYQLDSAGLWGIEDDSDEACLAEVFEDQRAELAEHIKAFGEARAV